MQVRARNSRLLLLLTVGLFASAIQAARPVASSSSGPSSWLGQKEQSAQSGDIAAIRELIFHYSLHDENDEAAFFWTLRAADLGEQAERGIVLGRFCGSSSKEQRAIGRFLAEKWGEGADCAASCTSHRCVTGTDGASRRGQQKAASSCGNED